MHSSSMRFDSSKSLLQAAGSQGLLLTVPRSAVFQRFILFGP